MPVSRWALIGIMWQAHVIVEDTKPVTPVAYSPHQAPSIGFAPDDALIESVTHEANYLPRR